MPYVRVAEWRDIQNRLKTAEEKIVELEEEKKNSQVELRPAARGGSMYQLNGWDITFYKNAAQLEQSDIKVYPEPGYNFKIANWKKDGDEVYLEIHSLSPTATVRWPGQLRDLNLRRNDLTGPDDPDLIKP